jgi:hypothetical protein
MSKETAARQAPVGQRVAMRLQGDGEQLYTCRADARDPSVKVQGTVVAQQAAQVNQQIGTAYTAEYVFYVARS